MRNHTKKLSWICIILIFINLAWLGYNSFMYLDIPKLIDGPDIYENLINVGLLLFFFSHLIIIQSVIISLKNFQNMSVIGIILLVLGTISFIFLFFHFLSLNEIWHDYKDGYPIKSMLQLTWFSQLIFISFYLYSLIYFIIIGKIGTSYIPSKNTFRENILVSLNIIGIVCSILGIMVVLLFMGMFNAKHFLLRFLIIPYGFVLLPYILALSAWGISCFKDRLSGIRDEKQTANMNRSGMLALQVSLLLIIGLTIYSFLKPDTSFKEYYFSGTIPVLWLPFDLFVILFVFSVTALYNFKKNKWDTQ